MSKGFNLPPSKIASFSISGRYLLLVLNSAAEAVNAKFAKLRNRVKVNITSTGTTNPLVLGTAFTGFQTFAEAGITDGQKVKYWGWTKQWDKSR